MLISTKYLSKNFKSQFMAQLKYSDSSVSKYLNWNLNSQSDSNPKHSYSSFLNLSHKSPVEAPTPLDFPCPLYITKLCVTPPNLLVA